VRTRIALEGTLTVPHWPLLITSSYEAALDVVRVPGTQVLSLPSGDDIATILVSALVFVPADAFVVFDDSGTATAMIT